MIRATTKLRACYSRDHGRKNVSNISNSTRQIVLSYRITKLEVGLHHRKQRAKTALVHKRFGSHPGRLMSPECHIWTKLRSSQALGLPGRPSFPIFLGPAHSGFKGTGEREQRAIPWSSEERRTVNGIFPPLESGWECRRLRMEGFRDG